MSDLNRNIAPARTGYRTDQVAIDAGLRAYMIRVYNYMATGVALTGVVAWLTYQAAGGDAIQVAGNRIGGLTAFGQAIFSGPLTLILFLGTLGLVFFLSFRINRLQPGTALGLFMVYAGLLGLMLASVFLTYTGVSITRVFFISAASFGALSLYGYTHAARSFADRLVPDHGSVRPHSRDARATVAAEPGPELRHLRDRRSHLRRSHRLGHPADQGDVRRAG